MDKFGLKALYDTLRPSTLAQVYIDCKLDGSIWAEAQAREVYELLVITVGQNDADNEIESARNQH